MTTNTGLTGGRIMRAATGQAIHRRGWDPTTRTYAELEVGLVHLTDGTRNSRTGRNLRALCGTSVRPEHLGDDILDAGRLCPKCNRERDARIAGRLEGIR